MTIFTKEQYIKNRLAELANQLPDNFHNHDRYSEILQQISELQSKLQSIQYQASLGAPSLRNRG